MNKIEKLKQISKAGTTYKGDLPEVEMLKHFNALLAIAERAIDHLCDGDFCNSCEGERLRERRNCGYCLRVLALNDALIAFEEIE